jgi:hypothetical protein
MRMFGLNTVTIQKILHGFVKLLLVLCDHEFLLKEVLDASVIITSLKSLLHCEPVSPLLTYFLINLVRKLL